jgi:hypothetical protein
MTSQQQHANWKGEVVDEILKAYADLGYAQDKIVTSRHFGDVRTVDKIILLISNVWVDWEEKGKREH